MRDGARLVKRRPWRVVYTNQAQKDARRIAEAGLRDRAQALLDLLEENPLRRPPPFEELVGDLAGAHSRRITIQHRLVYQVLRKERTVKVLRMWTHYE
jgi:toxin YoeB